MTSEPCSARTVESDFLLWNSVATGSKSLIVRYQVGANVPAPARTAVSCVQSALGISRHAAQKLIHDGAVEARGKVLSQDHVKLNVGDELVIDYAPQPMATPRKKSRAQARFEIVHDDEHLMVVQKPARMLTMPSKHRESNSLLSQIQKWLDRQQPGKRAICVHRLDRDVSGLLVFAKGTEVATELRSQFAARKPDRKYVAIVRGSLKEQQGTFRSYLTTDERTLNRYSVADSSQGELAITHFRVKDRWGDVTFVEVKLETGRRNQIRVHFSEAGHPILGDVRYGQDLDPHPAWPFARVALHAESLGFKHPFSQQPLLFSVPWPTEFREFRRQVAGKK